MRLVLLFKRSAAAQAAFEQLVADQQTPGSPVFHKAVTPQQQGLLYGPTENDIAAVKNWAESEGFTVGALSPNRTTLELEGTLLTAESALHVHFSNYNTVHGLRLAPDAEPAIPTNLAPVIAAIGGMTSENAEPLFTGSKGNHFIAPADFATIYDVNPVYAAGNTGATIGKSTQHIAILGAGTYSLTAMYSGDALYLPSTSVAGPVYVAAQAPGLTLATSPSSILFTSGATTGNTVAISVTGTNNFAGSAALTCTISSSAAANQPTCSINPTTVTLGPNGSASATVIIGSTVAHASLSLSRSEQGQRQVVAAGMGLFGFALVCGLRKRRPVFLVGLLIVVVSASTLGLSGCSGSAAPVQSSAGTYTVTVSASGTGNGALAATSSSTTFSVVIQ